MRRRLSQSQNKGAPFIDVLVHGQHFKALVDTGCSMEILTPKACTSWVNCHHCVVAVDGSQIPCFGKAMVPLSIDGNVIEVNCLVAKRLFGNIDAVVGMDVIRRLGGVVITGDSVAFLNTLGKSGTLNEKVWSSEAKRKALKSELITIVKFTQLCSKFLPIALLNFACDG